MSTKFDYVSTLPTTGSSNSLYKYRLKNFTGSPERYTATFFTSIMEEDGIAEWIDAFSRQTHTNWSVRRTFPQLLLNVRKDFVCHFNVYHHKRKKPSNRDKNTSCPATIMVKIKTSRNKRARNRLDPIWEGMPAIVTVVYQHNHVVLNTNSLSFLRLDTSVRERFNEYFDHGMTAAAALDYHTNLLELDTDIENIALTLADASINPSYSTVSYLFTKWRKANAGKHDGESIWDTLEQKLSVYWAAGVKISMQRQPFCVAIVTPLMQRAHVLRSSGEVVFVDSTVASCEASSHVITFMLVASPCGAVPVGVTLTAGQSVDDYLAAFTSLRNLLNEQGFCSKGYPHVFVTDDCAPQKEALHFVWPEAEQKLCHFRMLQAVWRWLWAAKHLIRKADRQTLMNGFRRVVYAVVEADAAALCAELLQASSAYPNFKEYVLSLWERREGWCMAYRHLPALRGHHTNNYAEVTVRLFKDNVLTRCKTFNVMALIEFVISVMERFYRNRLERFATGTVTAYSLLLEKLLSSCSYISKKEQIQPCQSLYGYEMYNVPSQSVKGLMYEVDAMLGVCSCKTGMNGRCCKHQAAVYKWFSESLPNLPPVSVEARHEAAYLAQPPPAPEPVHENESKEEQMATAVQSADDLLDDAGVTASVGSDNTVDLGDDYLHACSDAETAEDVWMSISDRVQQLLKSHGSASKVLDSLSEFKKRLDGVRNRTQLCSLLRYTGPKVRGKYKKRKPVVVRRSRRVRVKVSPVEDDDESTANPSEDRLPNTQDCVPKSEKVCDAVCSQVDCASDVPIENAVSLTDDASGGDNPRDTSCSNVEFISHTSNLHETNYNKEQYMLGVSHLPEADYSKVDYIPGGTDVHGAMYNTSDYVVSNAAGMLHNSYYGVVTCVMDSAISQGSGNDAVSS